MELTYIPVKQAQKATATQADKPSDYEQHEEGAGHSYNLRTRSHVA